MAWQRFLVRLALTGLTDEQCQLDLPNLRTELELYPVFNSSRVLIESTKGQALVELEVDWSDHQQAGSFARGELEKLLSGILEDCDEIQVVVISVTLLGSASNESWAELVEEDIPQYSPSLENAESTLDHHTQSLSMQFQVVTTLAVRAADVVVSGEQGYVATLETGLLTLDIRDPDHPGQLGHQDAGGRAGRIAMDSGYLTVVTNERALRLFRIHERDAPSAVGGYMAPARSNIFDLALAHGYAFIAGGYRGLSILDMRNAVELKEVAVCGATGRTTNVAVDDARAYVGNADRVIRIFDVSNPEQPAELGSVKRVGLIRSVAVAGKYLYVTVDSISLKAPHSLLIFDVSDPVHPRKMSSYPLPAHGLALFVSHGVVYVSSGKELRVLDVADPLRPTQLGVLELAGPIQNIAVAGKYVYVAAFWGGLSIVMVDRVLPELSASSS